MQKLFVEVSGHKLAYEESGAGETLLLVHGITTYSFIWKEMIASLAARYRVLAVDLLGCGDSEKPLYVSYALKDHAQRLKEVADKLGITKFHFVGHDLGGGIGQIFAVRYPASLFDLTLINTVAYDFWPVQPIIAMRTPIIRQFMMASMDVGTFRLIVRRGLFHKKKATKDLMSYFMRPMGTPDGRKAFLHFARCLNNHDLTEIAGLLPSLPMPVLIIRGEADPYLSSAISDKLHREIPNSRLATIATGGHFLMIDEPEVVTSLVLEFVGGQHA